MVRDSARVEFATPDLLDSMHCTSKGQLEHTEVNFLIHLEFVSELGNYTEIVMSFLVCGGSPDPRRTAVGRAIKGKYIMLPKQNGVQCGQ
jgi:hypothetical protein